MMIIMILIIVIIFSKNYIINSILIKIKNIIISSTKETLKVIFT